MLRRRIWIPTSEPASLHSPENVPWNSTHGTGKGLTTGSPARASLPAYVPYGGYSTLYPLSDSLLGVDELWDRWRCLEVMNALGLDDILDGPPSLRYGEVQCAS